MKIRELAIELGVEARLIQEFLVKEGAEVKNIMSVIPDDLLPKAKERFAKKTGEVKVVALPDFVVKKVEEEAKQRMDAQARNASPDKASSSGQASASADGAPKKKKKIIAVFNPQNSSSQRGKQVARTQKKEPPKPAERPKRPLPSQIRPARDRKPDDYVAPEKTEIVQQPAAAAEVTTETAAAAQTAFEQVLVTPETRPEPAVSEQVKAEPVQEVPVQSAADVPEVKAAVGEKIEKEPVMETAEKAPETAPKEEAVPASASAAAEEKAPAQKAEEAPAAVEKPAQPAAPQIGSKKESGKGGDRTPNQQGRQNAGKGQEGRRQKNTSSFKGDSKQFGKGMDKAKESEAIKSLREKLVKGTVNPEDLLGPARPAKGKTDRLARPGQDGQAGQKRRDGRPAGEGRDNRGPSQGRSGGSWDKDAAQGRGPRTQDGDNRFSSGRQGAAGGRSGGRFARPQAGEAAQITEDTSRRGKGGKPSKGRFEKERGDKFDRLENERGAAKNVKTPVKQKPEEEEIKTITIPDAISVKDFAAKIKMTPAELIKKLFLQGKAVTLNDVLDYDTAEEIALDMDIIAEHEVQVDYIAELLREEDDPEETLKKRPPVVVIMGHVDHGKTSLLDAIRKTNVTAGEAGGITQHIGAYTVSINGESITFLDTPGHEAFTAMRLRGAQATDVAILVVAADDGVMPQTIEAINHAKAANIHIIVAVNKIDKPGANVDRVKQELSEQGLVPGDWGGETIFVPVSAKTGEGIDSLLEMVLLDTEILELRANPDRMARGIVLEARLDKGRGSVVSLLVQKGTLKVGDHIAMGESYGKVRAMTNDKGQKIKTATPSTPVEITGLNGVPNAGETFVAFDNDKDAKHFAQVFIEENKKKLIAGTKAKMSLDDVFSQMKAGELKELDIIIKADVQGSVEAIRESLEKLSNDEVVVRTIHSGVGNVSETDAILASASNAIIIAFNVGINPDAKDTIDHEKVDLRNYNVIYNAIDDVELAMKGMLKPIYEEVVLGHIEVRQTFKASGVGVIAGSYITDGIVKRDSKVRLSRDGEQLFDGPIASLKRFNDDVKEVRTGFECGIVLKDFQDIHVGDVMEAYEMKEVPRT